MSRRRSAAAVPVALLALLLGGVPVAVLLVLGLLRRPWQRLGPVRQQQSGLRWLMGSRVAVAGEYLVRGRVGAALSWLFTGAADAPVTSSRRALTAAGEAARSASSSAPLDMSGAYAGLLNTLRASAAGTLGTPAAAPLAVEYLQIVERIAAREAGERGRGFLGIASRADRIRAVATGRRWASAMAGIDLTGFGWDDAADLAVAAASLVADIRALSAGQAGTDAPAKGGGKNLPS